MSQIPLQFEIPLLRIGSIAFIAGAIIAVVSTLFHPSTEDPNNHLLVFAVYASNDSWVTVHIGQFVGVIMVLVGGFVALHRLLTQSESSVINLLAWVSLAIAIITASAFAALQAVDGIAQERSVNSWIAAPPEEKAIALGIAEAIRFIEYGTNSVFRILQGILAIVFGVVIVMSKILSKWIGVAGVVIGAVTVYAGLEVAYLGFGGLTTTIGISMIIYFIWVGILGGFMWKKSVSKRI